MLFHQHYIPDMVTSYIYPDWQLNCNLGMGPDQESNAQLSRAWDGMMLQPTAPLSQGCSSLKLHNTDFCEYTVIYFLSLKTMDIELLSVFCSFKQFWHEILIHDFHGHVYKIFFCFIRVELVGHGGHTFNFNKVITIF